MRDEEYLFFVYVLLMGNLVDWEWMMRNRGGEEGLNREMCPRLK